jgi:hypothetical protein
MMPRDIQQEAIAAAASEDSSNWLTRSLFSKFERLWWYFVGCMVVGQIEKVSEFNALTSSHGPR